MQKKTKKTLLLTASRNAIMFGFWSSLPVSNFERARFDFKACGTNVGKG